MPKGRRAALQELTTASKITLKRLRCCALELRLELLVLLIAGPESVSGLAELLDLDMPMVSVHLSALRAAGMVVCEVQRTRRIQSLSSAVTLRTVEGRICLRIEVPGGFPVMIEIPRELLDRIHPGLVADDKPLERLPVVVLPRDNHSRSSGFSEVELAHLSRGAAADLGRSHEHVHNNGVRWLEEGGAAI